jgi:RNA polymerase sigma factor, sigma-70 family
MTASEEFKRELISEYPNLFRFAMSMTKNRAEAEDLAQETVAVALDNAAQYQVGTSMKAWLFKQQFFLNKNNRRRVARQRRLSEGKIDDPETAISLPSQLDRLMFREAAYAVESLPEEQREVMYLVVYDGKTYEQAAEILACSPGTVKSRVARARARLSEILHEESAEKKSDRELVR